MGGSGVEKGQALLGPGECSPARKDQSRDILQQILEEDDDTAAFLESLGVGEEQLGAIKPANLSQAEAAEKEKRGNYRLIDYRKRLKHNEPKRQGSDQHAVLLPKPLARISQRIASPKTQTEAGFPTCIAVSKWIAVGFAHSQVFVFNLFQELKGILGSSAELDQYGSVTSIDICNDPAVDWAGMFPATRPPPLPSLRFTTPPRLAVADVRSCGLPERPGGRVGPDHAFHREGTARHSQGRRGARALPQ